MTAKFTRALLAAAALSLGACATTTPPVDVTRFHLGQAIERGSFVVEPIAGGDPQSLEFRTYAAAVARELQRVGYVQSAELGDSLLVAVVDVHRGTREALAQRSPVSIGIGGGTGGYRGGVGGGISFGLGGGGSRDVVATELAVQLKRRADQSILWEGRAQVEARENTPAAQPGIAASRLAEALFRDFPGESGRTIRIR